jgi:hypothetical protein
MSPILLHASQPRNIVPACNVAPAHHAAARPPGRQEPAAVDNFFLDT